MKFSATNRREAMYAALYTVFAVLFAACAVNFGIHSMWLAATEYIILCIGNLISIFVTLWRR